MSVEADDVWGEGLAAPPPKLKIPLVPPVPLDGAAAVLVWPKLKVDATEVAAAGAGVEAAAVDCPKLNIPPPDVALGASLVDGASGFLPKAPKAEDGAVPLPNEKAPVGLDESVTSGLGSSVLAALDVGAAVLAPKENGVDPLEEPPPPPVLPKLKTPPVSFGLFSDAEASLAAPPKEKTGLALDEVVVVVAAGAAADPKENVDPEVALVVAPEEADAEAAPPKLKAGAGFVVSGLAAALLAPKLKGGGAAEAATSGLEAVEVAPKLKAGGAAAAEDVAAAVVAGVAALAAAPPKLKVEVEEAAGAPDSEVWVLVLPPAPKLKAPVEVADGAVDVVEVEAVDGVVALDAALPKPKAGGAAVAVEVASVVLAVSSALLAVADEDPKEKVAPLLVVEPPDDPKANEGLAGMLVVAAAAEDKGSLGLGETAEVPKPN